MQFVEAGLPLSFEVTYDASNLHVAMTVYRTTTGTPVFVATIPMSNFYGNSYFANFTPAAGNTYSINKAVYTDNTYATIDVDYSQGSESIRADDFAGLFLNAVINNYLDFGTVGLAIKQASQAGPSSMTVVVGASVKALISSPTLRGKVTMPRLIGIVEVPELQGEV